MPRSFCGKWRRCASRARREGAHGANVPVLVERLSAAYPPEHEVVLYEASPFPAGEPLVKRLSLAELARTVPTPQATLYVPPLAT